MVIEVIETPAPLLVELGVVTFDPDRVKTVKVSSSDYSFSQNHSALKIQKTLEYMGYKLTKSDDGTPKIIDVKTKKNATKKLKKLPVISNYLENTNQTSYFTITSDLQHLNQRFKLPIHQRVARQRDYTGYTYYYRTRVTPLTPQAQAMVIVHTEDGTILATAELWQTNKDNELAIFDLLGKKHFTQKRKKQTNKLSSFVEKILKATNNNITIHGWDLPVNVSRQRKGQ